MRFGGHNMGKAPVLLGAYMTAIKAAIEDHATDRVMLVAEIDRARAERDIARADREAAEQAAATFGRAAAEMRDERDAAHAEIAELYKCADMDRKILDDMRAERSTR